ncbi:hypothetical protein BDW62DRAFT_186309 [Aspergillus aurantiobrunneus]
MQWKSFVFLLATAGPALARSHGSHHHRHGVRHEHEAAVDTAELLGLEPIIVTETAWVCCTSSALSSSTPTVSATSTATPSSTQPVETSTSTTTTTIPVVPSSEPAPTSSETPTQAPEPTTTSTTVAAPTSTEAPSSTSDAPLFDWTNFPTNGEFSWEGFGGRTAQDITGNKFTYSGNVGVPWGSNIQEVTAEQASQYKYVIQFHGSKTDPWTVVVWNKIGPDMKMTGWYGNSALTFKLQPNEIRYVAFDENSQGSFGAAKGDTLPTDEYGGYSCTWGEFDLGSEVNDGWSGWDVSAIQAQAAGDHIQGMKMCAHDGTNCSIITTGAAKVEHAYLEKHKWEDGIGGKVIPGAVRIVTHLDYDE